MKHRKTRKKATMWRFFCTETNEDPVRKARLKEIKRKEEKC